MTYLTVQKELTAGSPLVFASAAASPGAVDLTAAVAHLGRSA
jgi:hypothetical protein